MSSKKIEVAIKYSTEKKKEENAGCTSEAEQPQFYTEQLRNTVAQPQKENDPVGSSGHYTLQDEIVREQ